MKTLYEYEAEISAAKGTAIKSCLVIGRALQAINAGRLWTAAAESFDKYCEQEHGFKRSWAHALIGVHEKFGALLAADELLQQADVTRLTRLLPYTEPDNAEEHAHAAAQIPTVRGFDDYVRALAGKPTTDECNHIFVPVPVQQCELCGLKVKK